MELHGGALVAAAEPHFDAAEPYSDGGEPHSDGGEVAATSGTPPESWFPFRPWSIDATADVEADACAVSRTG